MSTTTKPIFFETMTSPGNSSVATIESEGNKRLPCPFHGCKRVYMETELQSHLKDHEVPAQSLPGKVLRCSTVGCSGSFPDMQKLMEHMRHHHKPNIFFLCESCRTKLRSYRGLLTHLHTCSKVSRGKPKPVEQVPPKPAAMTTPNMAAMDQKPLKQEPGSMPLELLPISVQNLSPFPPAVVQPSDSGAPPLLSPHPFSHAHTPHPLGSTEEVSHSQLTNMTSPPSINMGSSPAATDAFDAKGQNQNQGRSPEPVHLVPVSTTHSPPGSSAIWNKSQGVFPS